MPQKLLSRPAYEDYPHNRWKRPRIPPGSDPHNH